jgi:archaellin
MKKAIAGVSILILLIVGLAITATGAALLYSKFSRYGRDSMISGKMVLDDIKSGVTIENIATRNDDSYDTLIVTIEPTEGSAPIDLGDMVIIIEQRNTTAILMYRNGTLARDLDNGYYTE